MILVVNCFYEDTFARDFDRAVADHLEGAGARFLRWTGLRDLRDPSAYSHLIISGSVASATEEQPWDQALGTLVRHFVDTGKPVLGICYGHQFLAKVLAGPQHVRRSPKPELGFIDLPLAPNPLFRGLEKPLVMVSHYDEAFDLPREFKVLASSPDCPVHAFQYRDLPVWGIQFHPEYSAQDGQVIWNEFFSCTPEKVPPPPAEPGRMARNRQIFRNFVAAGQ
ncbi:MAG: type 1 glutamine amidotransferase [Holophaga sp.]|jgi:GMP synthase (glutamine-hydrolysing)